jgi:hypothetical protein
MASTLYTSFARRKASGRPYLRAATLCVTAVALWKSRRLHYTVKIFNLTADPFAGEVKGASVVITSREFQHRCEPISQSVISIKCSVNVCRRARLLVFVQAAFKFRSGTAITCMAVLSGHWPVDNAHLVKTTKLALSCAEPLTFIY